jgi:hypothetical protein
MNEYKNITKGLTEGQRGLIRKVLEKGNMNDMFVVAYCMWWSNKAKQMVEMMKQEMQKK